MGGGFKLLTLKSSLEHDISNFIDECRATFDEDFIVSEEKKVQELAQDPAVGSKKPQAFLYPSNSKEVKKLLELANKYKAPLWIYSTGKNWGYLNTTNNEDSVVVILSRMNRIIKVDDELAYAEIEPGVTYQQLNKYLKDNNYNLWTDSPGGPPTGSVIGNALDRGVGVTEYADHYAHLCGLEVMLPDGNTIHTGALSPTQHGASHFYKWGVGPIWEGMFSQSNYGVVIKAGIWLMRKPKDYALLSVGIESDKKLTHAIDQVRELMLSGILPEVGRFSNDLAMLTLVTQAISENLDGKRSLSKSDLDSLKEKYRVPSWQASFALYGETDVVNLNAKKALGILKKSGKAKIFTKSKAARIRNCVNFINASSLKWLPSFADKCCQVLFNSSLAIVKLLPSLIELHEGNPIENVVRRGYFRAKTPRPDKNINVAKDGVGLLWFVPVLPFKGQEIENYLNICREDFEAADIDFYVTIMIFNARTACPLMAILYDPKDSEDSSRAQKLYLKLLEKSQELGYQQFRAGVNAWPHLFKRQPNLRELNNKLKALLDPNKILAPGRYGIE